MIEGTLGVRVGTGTPLLERDAPWERRGVAHSSGDPAPPFSGTGVALVTFFGDDGRVLVDETAAHALALAERGVRSVTVAGTTGEPRRLTADDRVRLVRACKRVLPARLPVLVGTGHAELAEAVALTKATVDSGADAILALSPPAPVDCRQYYDAVAGAAGRIPVMAYHFPRVSPPGIPVGVLADLPVCGIKDSSGDADRLAETLARYGGPVYVGSASYLALAGPLGATGAILALANLEPERCAAAFSGDIAVQRDLIDVHLRSLEHFPADLKSMVAARFGPPHGTR